MDLKNTDGGLDKILFAAIHTVLGVIHKSKGKAKASILLFSIEPLGYTTEHYRCNFSFIPG